MWGAAACALSASMLSHFSITRKVSSPHFFWNGSALSASTAAPYSMQPCSARTAGTLARNASRIAARLPGLAGMTATTGIILRLLFVQEDQLGRFAQLAKYDGVLLEQLGERLGVGAVDADDQEARLGPAAEGIAALAPVVRVARGGDEVLQRGVGDAVLLGRARIAARIRGGDERRGGGAFVADQLVEHRARLADAQHELAVGEDHVIGVAVGVDLLRSRDHNQGPQPTEANMPYTPVVPKGSAPRLARRSTNTARSRSTSALHPGIDPR